MSTAVDDLLDVPAAAEHVGCSVGTIRYRIAKGGLMPTVHLGGSHFFTAADLNAHFEEIPLRPNSRRWRR